MNSEKRYLDWALKDEHYTKQEYNIYIHETEATNNFALFRSIEALTFSDTGSDLGIAYIASLFCCLPRFLFGCYPPHRPYAKKACPHFFFYTNMKKIKRLHHVKEHPKISSFLQFESHSSKSFKDRAISD